jgi:hypothetical protein
MPATVSQAAAGIATRLATISGLRSFAYQPEQLNPPVAFPVLNSIEYHGAMGGGNVRMNFDVIVIVGRYVDRVAHSLLDAYLSYSGATSLRAAMEADRTLGGVASTLIMDTSTEISTVSVADGDFLQVSCSLTVHA